MIVFPFSLGLISLGTTTLTVGSSWTVTGSAVFEYDESTVTFNADHPFFREVYSKLEELEREAGDEGGELARQIRHAVDLLLMAYGRAESMLHLSNPTIDDAITELRTYWGVNLRKYVLGLTRESS